METKVQLFSGNRSGSATSLYLLVTLTLAVTGFSTAIYSVRPGSPLGENIRNTVETIAGALR